MITTIILAIVESFLATLAYAILFNVPKQYYTACGITGMAGWLLYLAMCQVTTVALASFVGTLAVVKGLEAVKIAFAIVLGIIFVVSIPRDTFQIRYWRAKRKRKRLKNHGNM